MRGLKSFPDNVVVTATYINFQEMFGGHGYKHILENVVPKLREVKGLSKEQIDKILINNPATILKF